MYCATFGVFTEIYDSVADGLLILAFSQLARVRLGKIIKGESFFFFFENFIVVSLIHLFYKYTKFPLCARNCLNYYGYKGEKDRLNPWYQGLIIQHDISKIDSYINNELC